VKPGLLRSAGAWIQAAHPFPIAGVLALTGLIGLLSAEGRPDSGRLALVMAAMLASQLAIGWQNDLIDREKDAVHQPAKPVASGLVEVRALRTAIVITAILAFVGGILLGTAPLVFLVLGTAAGFAYNLGVKDTRLSWLPYVWAFAVLPRFVWSALGLYREELEVLYAVGAPLAVAAHLANVLPDLEADASAGRPGIAVALGRRRTLQLLGLLLAAPLLVIGLTLPFLAYEEAVLSGVSTAYLFLLAMAVLAYKGSPFILRQAQDERLGESGRRERDVWVFRFVVVAAITLATGWLAAVG
jgi:4-hydroxybenzoate polyprenyltransferase